MLPVPVRRQRRRERRRRRPPKQKPNDCGRKRLPSCVRRKKSGADRGRPPRPPRRPPLRKRPNASARRKRRRQPKEPSPRRKPDSSARQNKSSRRKRSGSERKNWPANDPGLLDASRKRQNGSVRLKPRAFVRSARPPKRLPRPNESASKRRGLPKSGRPMRCGDGAKPRSANVKRPSAQLRPSDSARTRKRNGSVRKRKRMNADVRHKPLRRLQRRSSNRRHHRLPQAPLAHHRHHWPRQSRQQCRARGRPV
mmetsp:Transcript_28595/g.85744  ORF Transcript_28595/g.85744 Transcript_28595/m.85744 type:complete len:253 (-) Transcript_28595:806-1564(-)